MAFQEISGEIQNKRKDGKGIQIFGVWYMTFSAEVLKGFEKGQEVKIVYELNKGFRNIRQISGVVKIPEIKPVQNNKLDQTTVNTILMSVKEIAVAYLNNTKEFTDLEIVTDKATECMLKAYHRIIS